MKPRNSAASLLVIGMLLLGVWLWGAGCDFTRVDEGAQRPIADIVASLATADTPSKAEEAIKLLFQKTGVGVDHKESLYDDYKFKEDDIAKLARAHADYVSGRQASTATCESVYAEVRQAEEGLRQLDVPFVLARPIEASVEDVLGIFDLSVQYALADPEQEPRALLAALAAEGGALPDAQAVPGFTKEQVLSPIERVLFSIWLHKYGPSIAPGAAAKNSPPGGGNQDCPTGTVLLAKFDGCDDGSCFFEKPAGNQSIVTLKNDTDHRQTINWMSTLPIEAIVLKGGPGSTVLDASGATSGSISKSILPAVGNGSAPNISNVSFCGDEPPDQCEDLTCCLQRCQAARIVCLASNPESTCNQQYKSCDAACHLQGFGD